MLVECRDTFDILTCIGMKVEIHYSSSFETRRLNRCIIMNNRQDVRMYSQQLSRKQQS